MLFKKFLRVSLLLVLLSSLTPAAWAEFCYSATELAVRWLEETPARVPIQGLFYLDEDLVAEEGRLVADLRLRLDESSLEALSTAHPELCVAWVLEADGELLLVHEERVRVDLAGAQGWRFGLRKELPPGTAQILVLVQEPSSRLWGAAEAEDAGEPLPPPGPGAVRPTTSGAGWHERVGGPASSGRRTATRRAPSDEVLIRIVPPRRSELRGATRFDALVATEAVAKVVFRLDGETVAERRRSPLLDRPFTARVSLADPPREQLLEVLALDEEGRQIGRDTLQINRREQPFRVRITGLEGDPAEGQVEVRATVTIPPERSLDRVELYRNEELLATFREPRVDTRVDTRGAGPTDFLRVAAFLTDGDSIDDVILLDNPEAVEQVEVNLVEIQTVVTGKDGKPVDDLRQDDFRIVYGGEAQSPQSFAYADDVPLLLGLVVDTSGSMQLLMHDTKKAAAKFLGTTVLPLDSAFLVDFDQRPRLLHDTTDDLSSLFLRLGRLEAGGSTAMYDAIVFSMLQFERQPGRKALVVLTDGDDHESRYGPKYCAELAQDTGVPIYVIGLGALDTFRRTYSKKDLRRITEGTGGRLYFVDSIQELDEAYAQIQAELRSQYSLSFYTERDLTSEERREIRVRVRPEGLEARTVVGPGSSQ